VANTTFITKRAPMAAFTVQVTALSVVVPEDVIHAGVPANSTAIWSSMASILTTIRGALQKAASVYGRILTMTGVSMPYFPRPVASSPTRASVRF